jgi:hypothetical protein
LGPATARDKRDGEGDGVTAVHVVLERQPFVEFCTSAGRCEEPAGARFSRGRAAFSRACLVRYGGHREADREHLM